MRIPCIQRRTKEGFKKKRVPEPLAASLGIPGPEPGQGKNFLARVRESEFTQKACSAQKAPAMLAIKENPGMPGHVQAEKALPPRSNHLRANQGRLSTEPIRSVSFFLEKIHGGILPGRNLNPTNQVFFQPVPPPSKTKKPVLLDRLPAKTKTNVCSSKKARLPGKAAWILPASFPVQPCSPKRNVT